MDQQTFDLIEHLSRNEKKDLIQRLGKLTEQTGQLAKAVLSYESVAGTVHRFTPRSEVVLRIADCFQVLLSMLYTTNLQSSFDEMEEVLLERARVWGALQANEKDVTFPLPYEVHITIACSPNEVDKFREACTKLNIKPILLEAGIMKDAMTSSVHMGDNGSAIRYVESISSALKIQGFRVIREKIETVPWHPAAPKRGQPDRTMPPNCYFESHLGVRIDTPEELGHFREKIERAKQAFIDGKAHLVKESLHVSRNLFKKNPDGSSILMVTFRSHTSCREAFEENVQQIKDFIEKESIAYQGFKVDKTIVEFSIYDTKVSHDKAWLESPILVGAV